MQRSGEEKNDCGRRHDSHYNWFECSCLNPNDTIEKPLQSLAQKPYATTQIHIPIQTQAPNQIEIEVQIQIQCVAK